MGSSWTANRTYGSLPVKSISEPSNKQPEECVDEEQPQVESTEEGSLLPPVAIVKDTQPESATNIKVLGIISVLLLGEVLANADVTLVLAAAGSISSKLGRLQEANWISTAFTLGVCSTQPLYGKLSDIFGRKAVLLWANLWFSMGCIVCGTANEFWKLILGRVISGIGGAGIMTMASIIITDMVPKRDVATWRSYVNLAMTLGRSLGGPLGGWISDAFGWHWYFKLFLGRVPLLLISTIISLRFSMKAKSVKTTPGEDGFKSSVKRVDYMGSFLLASQTVMAILILDRGGTSFSWASTTTLALVMSNLVLTTLFVYWEILVAKEPIFSLPILVKPNVLASYMMAAFQNSAQVGLMYSVPLYFQVTAKASSTNAGIHIVPAVVGNALGALLAGIIIRKTANFKWLLVCTGMIASVTYSLLISRWNGSTGFWESLYIIPGGIATGMTLSGSFVSMASLLEQEDLAMATGGFFLFTNLGIIGGITITNAILRIVFRSNLETNLNGPGVEKIIQHALSDVEFISQLKGDLREVVVKAYISGLKATYALAFSSSIFTSILAVTLRNCRL